jgi:hypothetical protein
VGDVGLDYNVLPLVLQMLDIPTSERNDLFESLRVMEESALTTMRNRRNQ